MSVSFSDIDLSTLSLEQLHALLERIEKNLEIRRFEAALNEAVQEYRGRDPRVIRF